MIQKFLMTSLVTSLTSTFLFAASDKDISEFFAKRGAPADLIKITKRNKIKDSDIEVITVKIANQETYIFSNRDYIFQDVINIKTAKSYTMDLVSEKIKVLAQQETPENILMLGDSKKPSLIMFTDPECPYCRKELGNIEERLKTNSLKLIFTPVHKKTSLQKAALIYKHTQNLKTDDEKIKIIRKYFDENATIDKDITDKDVESIEKLVKKYFGNGLRGVPFIIE